MSKVQCWDVVEDLINEASKRVKPLYAVNEEKMEYVKNVCKTVIQDAADSNDAEAYEVEVDKITMEIRVSVKFENYPTRLMRCSHNKDKAAESDRGFPVARGGFLFME